MSAELRQLAQLLAERSNSFVSIRETTKQSAVPVQEIDPSQAPPAEVPGGPGAPPPPVDPATGQPMDPAAAGGAPVDPATGQPMDPAMAQQMMDPAMAPPMDPAMAGGAPPPEAMAPEEDPLVQMLQQMADNVQRLVKESAQNRQMLATILDASGLKIPTDDILRAGEDAAKEAMPVESPTKKAMHDYDGYIAVDAVHSEGMASYKSAADTKVHDARPALSSALQVAGMYFGRNR